MSELVRMAHPRLGVRDVRIKAVNAMRHNGWRVADELGPDEATVLTAGAGAAEATPPVRMVHPRLGVRHVPHTAVDRMETNGWSSAPLNPPSRTDEQSPEAESRADTPPRRRRKTDNSDQKGSD
jgi:hypothetical protein